MVPVVSLLRFIAMVRVLKAVDRFRCRDCHRVFLLTYTCEARKPGVKEQITEMAFNGAGVRDTARTLKIGINTVSRTLKNRAKANNIISGRSCRRGSYLRAG